MPVALPDLCPTSCRYTAPFHPVRVVRSISGAASRLLYGSRASQARLEMNFAADDAGAASWLTAHKQARGDFDVVTLPPRMWVGAEKIAGTIPPYITWHFDGPPSVDRTTKGRAQVRVSLLGDLEA
jgi:hypothetical protein